MMLGGQEWIVEHSLRGDLLGSLLIWQVEVELGDLLVQYPPDQSTSEWNASVKRHSRAGVS